MIGSVFLGRVQNVLPSMEAAFVDIGRGRNAVLYAGEVNWDAAGLAGKARRIETALSSGDTVLAQVSKDPVGHKGARLTTQISLPGRFLVYVPGGGATGISRKLPDTERKRLKSILDRIVPADAGVIIRTAAEGIAEEELVRDVERLKAQWEEISRRAGEDGRKTASAAPTPAVRRAGHADQGHPRPVQLRHHPAGRGRRRGLRRGRRATSTAVAPELADRLVRYEPTRRARTSSRAYRIDEQIAKALERKVHLPSGGSLVIDRTEAMTVVDVNTGKYTGSGGNLEETVTKNNLEAAEEIVRQLRLRDIGGIIVVDFIDMVLESNRELVLRRLTECLGRDRTRHQVAEVTSLGLVQMTRKRMGTGLVEAFSEPCPHCGGRGMVLHDLPVARSLARQRRRGRPNAPGPRAGGRAPARPDGSERRGDPRAASPLGRRPDPRGPASRRASVAATTVIDGCETASGRGRQTRRRRAGDRAWTSRSIADDDGARDREALAEPASAVGTGCRVRDEPAPELRAGSRRPRRTGSRSRRDRDPRTTCGRPHRAAMAASAALNRRPAVEPGAAAPTRRRVRRPGRTGRGRRRRGRSAVPANP